MIILSQAKEAKLELEGTIMALDWGGRRVGFATADSSGIAITPRGHFKRKSKPSPKKGAWHFDNDDLRTLKDLRDTWEVQHWVMGWPVNKGGIESEASRLCADLAQELEKELGGEFILVDETLTSWEQKNSGDVDAGAAATILEDFFEQRRRLAHRSGNIRVAVILILGLLFLLAGTVGRVYYQFAFQSAGDTSTEPASVIVDVKPGSSFQSVRRELENDLGFKINDLAFRVWSKLNLSGKKLRIGEYRIQKSWSAQRIFSELVSGSPLLYKVVVKEGYNMWDIFQAFRDSRGNQSSEVLEKELKNTKRVFETFDFLKTQVTQPKSLEGFLFPETYSYQKYDSPRKLVDAMIEQFRKRALPILEQHPWSKEPGGTYRLLILASIVEKESGVKEEQPLIASVFWNRLAKRMKLQSDPTTIYGLMPNFLGNLTRLHLTTPSQWNTYTLPELPVTPISNPGESALRAVVNPENTEYIFFVSKNDGTHLFSKDYKTHNAYVEEYQKKRRAPKVENKSL